MSVADSIYSNMSSVVLLTAVPQPAGF